MRQLQLVFVVVPALMVDSMRSVGDLDAEDNVSSFSLRSDGDDDDEDVPLLSEDGSTSMTMMP